MIYLASPYSHPDPEVRQARYLGATAYVNYLMDQQKAVFSPIVYGHIFAVAYEHSIDAASHRRLNTWALNHSSIIHVLMLEGWKSSKGIVEEVFLAKFNNLPILYIEKEPAGAYIRHNQPDPEISTVGGRKFLDL